MTLTASPRVRPFAPRWATVVLATAAICLVGGCGSSGSSGSSGADGDGASTKAAGEAAAFVEVQVADGASIDADREGGDPLDGVELAASPSAVCTTGVRVGVVPETVDEDRVEDWTNATEEPVVYLDAEDVTGDTGDLASCSMAYEESELASTVLHGQHMHDAHS